MRELNSDTCWVFKRLFRKLPRNFRIAVAIARDHGRANSSDSDLGAERTRLINKLKANLRSYRRAFLEAAPDLGTGWAVRLWELAPTPDRARRGRKASVEAALRKSRARLRGKAVPPAPGTVKTVSEAAGRIVSRLKACNEEIKEIRSRIREAVGGTRSAEGGRAIEILKSVPGIGTTILAVIISEDFDSIRRADVRALRCYFGVASVTKRSGREILVRRRLAANTRLANAANHWAMNAVEQDPASKAKYSALRQRGLKRAEVLRGGGPASRRRLQNARNRPDLRPRKTVESQRMKPESDP